MASNTAQSFNEYLACLSAKVADAESKSHAICERHANIKKEFEYHMEMKGYSEKTKYLSMKLDRIESEMQDICDKYANIKKVFEEAQKRQTKEDFEKMKQAQKRRLKENSKINEKAIEVITIGKYKNRKTYEDIVMTDSSYATWLVREEVFRHRDEYVHKYLVKKLAEVYCG